MLLTGDLEHHLIEMPFVARPGQPSADDVGELLAKLESPLPDRLMADLDAAEGQHLLDHPKAQRESKVQPHRVADQLRREAVAGVEGLGRARHAGLIPDPRCSPTPPRRQLDDALQHVLTALAINIVRLDAWWCGIPPAKTRQSRFVALMA